MRYISIDLETTGLDDEFCQIIEFGAVLEDTNNPLPIDELPYFHAYITHPGGKLSGDVYALNLNADIINKLKNQKKLEDQYNFIPVDQLAASFLVWLADNGFEVKKGDGYIGGGMPHPGYSETINVAGKNFNSFDRRFLNKVPYFNRNIKIRHRVIDPAALFVDWTKDDSLPNLDECKRRAGIDGSQTHRAVDDAKDVIKLLRTKYRCNN